MCEGVCSRCRDKVQWRFKYDKYKPLKNPAKCQECKQKTVHKAYRTFCDNCSSKKKVCPSCCLSYDEIEAARLLAEQENAVKKDENDDGATIDKLNIEMDEEEVQDDENDEEDEEEDDDEDNEMDADNDDNEVEGDDNGESTPSVFASMSSHKISFNIGNDEKIKDKYSAILETKYSKNRTIGNETKI
jgi:hypothetical protein